MAETEVLFETRLIGAEDVNWDNSGTGKKETFIDGNGAPHDSSLINAMHVPLPSETRALLDNEGNVAAGMEVLANRISAITGGSSSSLNEDTTINLDSTQTTSAIQSTIDQQPKNLGGHTLTFLFSEGFDASLSSSLVFDGFYNGFLVVDLNEDTVSDAASIGSVFHLHDCFCKVEVKNGAVTHTLSDYGIKAERCPCVYLTGITFTSVGGSGDYGFCGIDSDGVITSCSFVSDKTKLISGIIAGLTEEHDSDPNAHSDLFAAKAPLVSPTFSGTPTAPTAAEGTNTTQVATTAFVQNKLSAADYVIASGNNGNVSLYGYMWYRKYKSGWLEQGGCVEHVVASGNTITLLQPFTNAHYTVLATTTTIDPIVSDRLSVIGPDDKSGSSFVLRAGMDSSVYWYACGQGHV